MSTTTSNASDATPAVLPSDAAASAAMPPPALPSTATESTQTANAPLSDLQTLRDHIQALTDLNNRLQSLRHIPALLLRPPTVGVHALPQSSLLRHEFQELKEFAGAVRSEKIQEALKAARKSEGAEPKMLGFDVRRDNLKRRRPPSPASPQPYRATEPKSSALLLHEDENVEPLGLDGLPAYIRQHNKSNHHKLHVVAPRKDRPLQCPIVLRFTIPDVAVVYLTLNRSTAEQAALVVESATAFGPREQKPTHSQSDFTVYQQLSQQLARVLQSEPWVPLQVFVTLLNSYENLFTEPCEVCGRVLSAEAHTPPVVRVRKQPSTESPSAWGVHHVACK
ncbi:hypothetical protein PYCCODRAFT_1436473 [Trametes coccinea BRFM310]|uniref:Mediator complex subunit 27 n=1 Tax=Trametes coccinea (strain BRFM310) TaxID=1353009 RepID=A0A1Y2IJG5_TRAC3|nr:hypothetical protein PYCCODRAFT_1436473 [Trametes coccinea BRFM310]